MKTDLEVIQDIIMVLSTDMQIYQGKEGEWYDGFRHAYKEVMEVIPKDERYDIK